MYKLRSRFAFIKEKDSLFSSTSRELKSYLCSPSNIWKEVNPQPWDYDVPECTLTAQPVKVTLKEPATVLHKKKYPLKPEAKAGLQPLIDKFLKCGILKPSQSPYNIPILLIKKPNGEYRRFKVEEL